MSEENESRPRTRAQWAGLLGGLVAAVVVEWGMQDADPHHPLLGNMAAVATLMAVWWLTEAIPIAATALVPLAFYPLMGIMSAKTVAVAFGDRNVFLYLGGFLIALGIEESGLHRRIALAIVGWIGDSPARLVLGFMVATWSLSMWLSNTATTLMMLPIAMSVLSEADKQMKDTAALHNFGIVLTLSIAYAASIGGIATLIGTPPNLVFKQQMTEIDPNSPDLGFARWMSLAFPLSLVFMLATWFLLVRVINPVGRQPLLGGHNVIQELRAELGPIRSAEWRIGAVFVTTALLWILREPYQGAGWAVWIFGEHYNQLFGGKGAAIDDSTVAMFMAAICFLIPSGDLKSRPLLTWSVSKRIPWGILLLFGGGLALARGMGATGLDRWTGQQLASVLAGRPGWQMIGLTTAGMTFFTEITSNLASTQMMLPVLHGVADAMGLAPAPLMIACTIAASCAFMLPVATPPNAIVYGSGRLTIRDMARCGLWVNLLGIVLVAGFVIVFR